MNKTKKIIVSIIVVLIMLAIMINPVRKLIYRINFENTIKKCLLDNCTDIEDIKFSGDYSLIADLKMSDSFENLEFCQQEEIIKTLVEKLKIPYRNYVIKMDKIDYRISYGGDGEIRFHVYDTYYNTSFASTKIHKESSLFEYKEKDYLYDNVMKSKIYDNFVSFELDNILSFYNELNSIEICKEISKIDDKDSLKKEIIYQYLKQCCENNKSDKRLLNYTAYLNDYKDSSDLFNKMASTKTTIEYDYPKLGMTKEQVSNSKWGKPNGASLDTDVNTGLRLDHDGKEMFIYYRNGMHIYIMFENDRAVKFLVNGYGDATSKEVSDLSKY